MPIHVRSASIAPLVLLPGDPDRARWIAENFFKNPVCTTSYRQMLGFNGTYKGHPVTVQTTGMGGPSAAIVCEELAQLGAKALVRIGTCGAMNRDMMPGDLMLVTAACMTDATSREIFAAHMQDSKIQSGFAPTSDFNFLVKATQIAQALHVPAHAGIIASMDRFYGHDQAEYDRLNAAGVNAVEMEAATVLTFAATHGLKAACMMTVSDQIDGAIRASEETILHGVKNMVTVALDAAVQTLI